MKIKKICENCEKEYLVPPSRSNSKFCSNKCKNEKGGWGKKKLTVTCLECGKIYKEYQSRINRGGGKYCSRLCKDLNQTYKGQYVKDIIDEYLNGNSSAYLSGKYDISDTTIRRILYRENITMRTSEEAIQLVYSQGKTKNQLNKKERLITSNGYIQLCKPEHHRADSRGYVLEHIFIWEQSNNKILPQGWVIHHLNGKKDDNRPENLFAMTNSGHTRREQAEPYKNRIRELEKEIQVLKKQLKP